MTQIGDSMPPVRDLLDNMHDDCLVIIKIFQLKLSQETVQ